MDRFIVTFADSMICTNADLKSNMDRFIAKWGILPVLLILDLKSNMDRFIEISQAKSPPETRI